MKSSVLKIIEKYKKDKNRLMDILLDIQSEFGYISEEITTLIADELNLSEADVIQTISFYHFLSFH